MGATWQGPLTRRIATFAIAICNGSLTSTPGGYLTGSRQAEAPPTLRSLLWMNSEFGLFQGLGTKVNLLVRRRRSNSRKFGLSASGFRSFPERPVQFEITELTRTALTDWIGLSGLASGDFLFPSRVRASPHLSTRQYARIVDSWVEEVGLDPAGYGTHSIRRTKPSLIYRRTKNLRAVQLLLGHTKLESTVRYLGIEVEDALELAEQTEV